MIATWQAPLPNSKTSEELLLTFDEGRERRVLIVPALFDEANKMRRHTVQMMRLLDQSGCDSFLPDLPGWNESLEPLEEQTLGTWRAAAATAAKHVAATHMLAIRGGALIAPADLAGWHYAAQTGPKLLRAMIRARILASREAGREETSEALLETGRAKGLMLAGWPLGAAMIAELESAEPVLGEGQHSIAQKDVGGAGLWLRAEAAEDTAQAEALAAIVAGNEEAAS